MIYVKNNKKGFSLVELLVVIAIIGIISSTVISNLNEARVTARDVIRRQQGKQIQAALEMYMIDQGKYPQLTSNGTTAVGVSEIGINTLNNVLAAPTYMTKAIVYDQTNISDAAYMSDTTKPNQYVLKLSFEKPIVTTPSVQYSCKTGVGTMVNTYYPGIPLCEK